MGVVLVDDEKIAGLLGQNVGRSKLSQDLGGFRRPRKDSGGGKIREIRSPDVCPAPLADAGTIRAPPFRPGALSILRSGGAGLPPGGTPGPVRRDLGKIPHPQNPGPGPLDHPPKQGKKSWASLNRTSVFGRMDIDVDFARRNVDEEKRLRE